MDAPSRREGGRPVEELLEVRELIQAEVAIGEDTIVSASTNGTGKANGMTLAEIIAAQTRRANELALINAELDALPAPGPADLALLLAADTINFMHGPRQDAQPLPLADHRHVQHMWCICSLEGCKRELPAASCVHCAQHDASCETTNCVWRDLMGPELPDRLLADVKSRLEESGADPYERVLQTEWIVTMDRKLLLELLYHGRTTKVVNEADVSATRDNFPAFERCACMYDWMAGAEFKRDRLSHAIDNLLRCTSVHLKLLRIRNYNRLRPLLVELCLASMKLAVLSMFTRSHSEWFLFAHQKIAPLLSAGAPISFFTCHSEAAAAFWHNTEVYLLAAIESSIGYQESPSIPQQYMLRRICQYLACSTCLPSTTMAIDDKVRKDLVSGDVPRVLPALLLVARAANATAQAMFRSTKPGYLAAVFHETGLVEMNAALLDLEGNKNDAAAKQRAAQTLVTACNEFDKSIEESIKLYGDNESRTGIARRMFHLCCALLRSLSALPPELANKDIIQKMRIELTAEEGNVRACDLLGFVERKYSPLLRRPQLYFEHRPLMNHILDAKDAEQIKRLDRVVEESKSELPRKRQTRRHPKP